MQDSNTDPTFSPNPYEGTDMNSPKRGTTWRQKRAARFAAGVAVAAITAAGIGIAAGGAGAATGWGSRMTVQSAAAGTPKTIVSGVRLGTTAMTDANGWGCC
jgi:hypothetical protein